MPCLKLVGRPWLPVLVTEVVAVWSNTWGDVWLLKASFKDGMELGRYESSRLVSSPIRLSEWFLSRALVSLIVWCVKFDEVRVHERTAGDFCTWPCRACHLILFLLISLILLSVNWACIDQSAFDYFNLASSLSLGHYGILRHACKHGLLLDLDLSRCLLKADQFNLLTAAPLQGLCLVGCQDVILLIKGPNYLHIWLIRRGNTTWITLRVAWVHCVVLLRKGSRDDLSLVAVFFIIPSRLSKYVLLCHFALLMTLWSWPRLIHQHGCSSFDERRRLICRSSEKQGLNNCFKLLLL